MSAPAARPSLTGGGLSETEASNRLAARGPIVAPSSSRSYASIVRANTLTIFNLILIVFGALTLTFGEIKDALFLGIVVVNTAIGVGQEIRAKRTLDRLAALVAPVATVVRDGSEREIPVAEVVVGDLLRLTGGNQVVADGRLIQAQSLSLDESVLTGESESVLRHVGDPVLSGSFVTDGNGAFEVEAVGADSQAERMAGVAREFRHPRSPLEQAMDRLLLILVLSMIPLAVTLIVSLILRDSSIGDAVQTATAGIVNMVPEGLILLASLTAVVAATRMANRGALAQQLNAVESLASVDMLCTDKTGTLTEAALRVDSLIAATGVSDEEFASALGRYATSAPARNGTLEAIAEAEVGGKRDAEPVLGQVPFSSSRRWSALRLGSDSLVLGAPERFELGELDEVAKSQSEAGRRVLAFGLTESGLPEEVAPDAAPPQGVKTLGLIVLAERLRPATKETVTFFESEKVQLRVLSGDNPRTVAAIARDAGIPHSGDPLDGSALPEDDAELRVRILQTSVVGRISPDGKRRVVEALAAEGNYVGMIGDGVNDVPALKASRLAIAQGSGTQMAKSVADIVLVKGDFAVVPQMVAEGRQILRNLQRVARLFVTKAVFAGFLIIAVGVTTGVYPLLPRQFTIASTLTIGIPAFILALSPSSGTWRPDRFLSNVLRFSIPVGLGIGVGIAGAFFLSRYGMDLGLTRSRTVATVTVIVGGLATVILLEAGGDPGRRAAVIGLCGGMGALLVIALLLPFSRNYFNLEPVTGQMLLAICAGSAVGILLAWIGLKASRGMEIRD